MRQFYFPLLGFSDVHTRQTCQNDMKDYLMKFGQHLCKNKLQVYYTKQSILLIIKKNPKNMYMSMTQRQNIVMFVYQQIRTLIKFQMVQEAIGDNFYICLP